MCTPQAFLFLVYMSFNFWQRNSKSQGGFTLPRSSAPASVCEPQTQAFCSSSTESEPPTSPGKDIQLWRDCSISNRTSFISLTSRVRIALLMTLQRNSAAALAHAIERSSTVGKIHWIYSMHACMALLNGEMQHALETVVVMTGLAP